MNEVVNAKEWREKKKEIDKKSRELDIQLMNAKNDFFLVLVFYQIQELIDAELLHWIGIVSGYPYVHFEEVPAELEEANKQVNELNNYLNKIKDLIALHESKALEIQQAMINSFELKEPKIFKI
jgi:hypothetical protein